VVRYLLEGELPKAYVRRRPQGFAREHIPGSNPVAGYRTTMDSPEDSENLRRSQGYTFPILSDAQEDVIRRWDLVHLHGRRDGADISRPAEFLIDPSGKVRWVNLTEDFVVRARPEDALAAFDAMNKSSRSGP
jgi:peroxiredoxin